MPLTREGICAQILSAISTFRQEYGSRNDCQVVVNHLIRKFDEPLERDGLQRHFSSREAIASKEPVVKDHVIPVKTVMDVLLDLADVELNPVNIDKLDSLLRDLLIVVSITKDQDAVLNMAGLQRSMPESSIDPRSLREDPWIRYKIAGIYDDIDLSAT